MVSDDHRSPHMPRHMVEEYMKIVLETQGRALEYDEAEFEAMNLLDGFGFLVESKVEENKRKKLHRILTNGIKEPRLGPVGSGFFG